jgi:uncharacterized phage-associated protein
MAEFYTQYSPDQLAKIGNAIIYFSERIEQLSKTKLLKLLYILDELAIKKSGIPVLNLKFKVWKFGPVCEDLFVELSSDTMLFKNYITKEQSGENAYILPKQAFDDAEFSQNDLDELDFVIEAFGRKTAKELVSYTHRANAPWYNTAKKHGVLDLLLTEQVNNTEFVIDMGELVQYDERKYAIYQDLYSIY